MKLCVGLVDDHQVGDEDGGWRQRHVGPLWVPHPRTGVYVPQGHERVMDDVPDSAASFVETYWIRNSDNADKETHWN